MTTPTPEAGVPEPAQLAEVQATDALLERLSRRASRPGDLDDPVFAALSDLAVHVEEDEAESAAVVAHMLELLQLGAAPDVQGGEDAGSGTASPEVTAAERPSRVIDLTEQQPAAEAPAAQEPAAQAPAAEEPAAEAPAAEAPATEAAAAEDAPAEVTAADETPAEDAPADETPADETPPADETAADETAADETAADETAADETAADETAAEEPPADETPAGDAPVEIAASAEPASADESEAEPIADEPVAKDAPERPDAPPTTPIPGRDLDTAASDTSAWTEGVVTPMRPSRLGRIAKIPTPRHAPRFTGEERWERAVRQLSMPVAAAIAVFALGSGVTAALTGDPMKPLDSVGRVVDHLSGNDETVSYNVLKENINKAKLALRNGDEKTARDLLATVESNLDDVDGTQATLLKEEIAAVEEEIAPTGGSNPVPNPESPSGGEVPSQEPTKAPTNPTTQPSSEPTTEPSKSSEPTQEPSPSTTTTPPPTTPDTEPTPLSSADTP
jgi:hypothetical protein